MSLMLDTEDYKRGKMLRKLISFSVFLLVVVLLATLTLSCRSEEPESTPPPPTSGAGQNFLIEVTKPDDARQSEWAFIFVYATCKLDSFTTVDKVQPGMIGICFPYLSDANNISLWSQTLDRYHIYAPGEKIATKYGTGSEITVPYPIIEGYQATWARNARENITIQVRPEHAGTFTFFVKAYGYFSAGSYAVTAHEPLEGTMDEQEEYVQVHSFQVAP